MFAALMIGHHFSISALWNAADFVVLLIVSGALAGDLKHLIA